MSEQIFLNAELRQRLGTNKNREIRREDAMVPAVIYGNKQETKNIKLPLNEIYKASMNENFYTQVLLIKLQGNEEKVVLKELQRDPEKGKFLHADFQRVSNQTKLKVVLPIKVIGEDDCIGIKKGGVLTRNLVEIEVACLAGNIPESLDIDITSLEIDQSIRLTQLILPQGVEIPGLDVDHDQQILNVQMPKRIKDTDTDLSSEEDVATQETESSSHEADLENNQEDSAS
ncbi:MAG: 50S ribosomal protein L25 [Gammaproteobacteria bacterium]